MLQRKSVVDLARCAGRRNAVRYWQALLGVSLAICAGARAQPEVRVGELLFTDSRFGYAGSDATNSTGGASAMSCATCHVVPDGDGRRGGLFADAGMRSAVPAREDGRIVTVRNSPPLVGALPEDKAEALLHFDAEFASLEELVAETFVSRNFGWLPSERELAASRFTRVLREERTAVLEGDGGSLSYAALLRGDSPTIPIEWRLSEQLRFDPAAVTDEEVLDRAAQMVAYFLRTLQFSRDASGQHDGSAYDAFLTRNLLPRAPRHGETDREYARRLGESIAEMRAPRFVIGATGEGSERGGDFGPTELAGMRIFFREAISSNQRSGAGNCVECHVPPHFSDFKFHNTGVAQHDYDKVHGDGAFEKLPIPSLAERAREPGRWLPATAAHPNARGLHLAIPTAAQPMAADLGLWNIYANSDFSAPQAAIERMLNPNGQRSQDEVLASAIGRFKTSHLRGLPRTPPYFHSGHARSLEDTVRFYARMSDLARRGHMRNAPREFFALRLGEDDIAPLVAFLRALDGGYTGGLRRKRRSRRRRTSLEAVWSWNSLGLVQDLNRTTLVGTKLGRKRGGAKRRETLSKYGDQSGLYAPLGNVRPAF